MTSDDPKPLEWRKGIRLGTMQGKRLRGKVREQACDMVRQALKREENTHDLG